MAYLIAKMTKQDPEDRWDLLQVIQYPYILQFIDVKIVAQQVAR